MRVVTKAAGIGNIAKRLTFLHQRAAFPNPRAVQLGNRRSPIPER
jgi:hypothetical protein